MKVCLFVTGALSRRGYLDAISGHVQIPLMAARILAEAGHDVTLLTTKPDDAEALPQIVPKDLHVCIVQHASRAWPQRGVYFTKVVKQVVQLRTLMTKYRFEVLHFFGGMMTGLLLCTLKSTGIHSTAFYSPIQRPPVHWSGLRNRMIRFAFNRIRRIIATADYVSSGWASMVGGQKVRVMYPGIVKQFSRMSDSKYRNSVLFWRNAGYDNGADIAMKSFRKLASRHPDVRFVFAVRPYDRYEEELLALGREIENIDVHIYPYGNGVTLSGLLDKARFVVQPFRCLSVNPQISILETLYAGVPVIATEIESNNEVIRDGQNGLLIPPNDEASLSVAVERLLCDVPLLDKLARNARPMVEARWNWDSFGRRLVEFYDELH